MLEWIGPILASISTAIIAASIAGLVWKGKIEEAHRQLRSDFDDHVLDAGRKIRDFLVVKENQAVMRQEIVSLGAQMIVNDRRLNELAALATNQAVMQSELVGIRAELVEIKRELKGRPV